MATDSSKPHTDGTARSGSFLWGASWARRKRLLRIEAWVLVIGAYAVIAFAHAWPTDFRNQNPTHVAVAWTASMVRTFGFHLGLLLLLIALAAARGRSWRLCIATTPLLLVTLGPAAYSFRPRSGTEVRGETLTVMSVNLLALNRDTAPIIAEIKAAVPDILLLQEYADHWHAALQDAIGRDYPHICYVTRDDSFGAAIYSRRPFVGEPQLDVPLGQADTPQIRAVITVEGRDLALYNIHLLPPAGIVYTMETRTQFADLIDLLANEPLPAVVGGDFNFTESSSNAQALGRLGFRDAHEVGGWGRGATWPVHSFFRWIPGIRLDHVYLSRELTSTDCRTGRGQESDHRPVVATIGFEQFGTVDQPISKTP